MNFWMITLTPQEYEDLRGRKFASLYLHPRHKRKADRMAVGDRVLLFVKKKQVFAGTATVAGPAQAEGSPPQRLVVPLQPVLVPEEVPAVDARLLAPSLEYVKRWRPEDWPLAFVEQMHLLSRRDFEVVETELRRATRGRRVPPSPHHAPSGT
ncbi:MAG: hypothetical protein NZ951_04580 [Dehalococcoidia bacterium]|nr:hypothetical protein [Dehalococcoidia bacterium]MDW8120341.1 hypothetical protein [Chloroflexota bacterium]